MDKKKMFNQLFIHEWLARRDNVLLFSTSSAKQSALSKKDVTKSIEE